MKSTHFNDDLGKFSHRLGNLKDVKELIGKYLKIIKVLKASIITLNIQSWFRERTGVLQREPKIQKI